MARHREGSAVALTAHTSAVPGTDSEVRVLHDDWPDLEFTLYFRNGILRGINIQTRSATAPAVTGTLLRQPPFPQLERVARLSLRDLYKALSDTDAQPRDMVEWASDQLSLYGFGRKTRHDPVEKYAVLANRYVELCKESKRPIEDLASEQGAQVSTMKNAIYKARNELGYLTPAKRGQKGGALTPKGERALARAAKEVGK